MLLFQTMPIAVHLPFKLQLHRMTHWLCHGQCNFTACTLQVVINNKTKMPSAMTNHSQINAPECRSRIAMLNLILKCIDQLRLLLIRKLDRNQTRQLTFFHVNQFKSISTNPQQSDFHEPNSLSCPTINIVQRQNRDIKTVHRGTFNDSINIPTWGTISTRIALMLFKKKQNHVTITK